MLWWVASRVKQQWTRDSIGLQAQGWVSFRGYPLLDCFRSSCMQKEGFQVFYQGLGTCLAQAAYLVNGAIFSTWICHWDSHDHVHLKNPNQFWAQSNASITKAWPSRQAKSSSYSLDASKTPCHFWKQFPSNNFISLAVPLLSFDVWVQPCSS
jgi:hypothetical protein